jgi:hypothetical protein
MLYTTSQSLFEMKYVMPFILNDSTHQKIFLKADIENSVIPGLIHGISREYADKHYVKPVIDRPAQTPIAFAS